MTATLKEIAEAIVRSAEATYVDAKPELEAMAENFEEMAQCRSFENSAANLDAGKDVMLLVRLADYISTLSS